MISYRLSQGGSHTGDPLRRRSRRNLPQQAIAAQALRPTTSPLTASWAPATTPGPVSACTENFKPRSRRPAVHEANACRSTPPAAGLQGLSRPDPADEPRTNDQEARPPPGDQAPDLHFLVAGAGFEPATSDHAPAAEPGRTSVSDLEAISEAMFTPTRVLASRYVGDTPSRTPGAAR